MIVKFLDKSKGGGLASVVRAMQVVWYPSGQWSTERLDPTVLIRDKKILSTDLMQPDNYIILYVMSKTHHLAHPSRTTGKATATSGRRFRRRGGEKGGSSGEDQAPGEPVAALFKPEFHLHHIVRPDFVSPPRVSSCPDVLDELVKDLPCEKVFAD